MTDTTIQIGNTSKFLRGVSRGVDGTSGIDEYVVLADSTDGTGVRITSDCPVPADAGMIVLPVGSCRSDSNNTTTALNAGQTFTGTAERNNYPDALVVLKTDQAGLLYIDQSLDGTNWDSSLAYNVAAGTSEVRRVLKASRYFRIRISNTSASNQTYLRADTFFGHFHLLTSPVNSVISDDADALLTRVVDPELDVALGHYASISSVNKFGRNDDIDTGSTPEDIWNGGGTYTGFPTGSPEELQVFSSDAADTGTFTFTYLASSTSTAYQTASVTLQGKTQVNTGVTVYRMHTTQYSSGSATGLNVGTITARHRTTTANVFCVMPIGRGQTYVAAYTVPAGSTAIVRRVFARCYNNTGSTTVEGGLWVRELNGSPRIRRPFTASNADGFEERPYAGLSIPAGSDIMVRILSTTANNTAVVAGYDIVLVKD